MLGDRERMCRSQIMYGIQRFYPVRLQGFNNLKCFMTLALSILSESMSG